MKDLLAGVGLVLVIEGALWGLGPNFARRLLEAAAATSEERLRALGVGAVALGVAIVWIVRG